MCPTQQLEKLLYRTSLDVGRDDARVLLGPVCPRATQLQLGEPVMPARDLRKCDPILVREGREWLPHQ